MRRGRMLFLPSSGSRSRRRAGRLSPRRSRSKSTSRSRRSSFPSTIRRGRGSRSSTSTITRTGTRAPSRSRKWFARWTRLNLRVMVNLSGDQGAEFLKGYRNLKGRYPKRFVVFANLDFDRHRRPGLDGPRGRASSNEDVRHGAQGLKIFKNLGTDGEGFPGQARRRRRSAARPGLGKMRRARDSGAHPLGRAEAVLRPDRPVQRALAGAQAISVSRPSAREVSELGGRDGRAAPDVREAPEDEIHRRSSRLARRRSRSARTAARPPSERVHGNRRGSLRARPPACATPARSWKSIRIG